MRIVTRELGEGEIFQQRLRAPLALRPDEALNFHAEHHVFEHGAPGQQQILLQHEGHVRVWTLHALAVDEGRTLAWRVKTRADVEQCRLAAATRADEGDNFAIANGEAHPLHRRERFPGSCRETHAHVAVFEPYQVRHGPNSSRQQRLARALVLQNDIMAYSGGRQNMAGERHAPRERVRWPHVR